MDDSENPVAHSAKDKALNCMERLDELCRILRVSNANSLNHIY